jgi:predicted nucleic acid-binding protein
MITAVDTNILLDILVPNEPFYEASASALEEAAGEGSIVISDIVYAEVCIHFEARRDCDAFLESNEIRVQALTREAHFPLAAHGECIDNREESGPEFWRIF